jgi:hypothetical protein
MRIGVSRQEPWSVFDPSGIKILTGGENAAISAEAAAAAAAAVAEGESCGGNKENENLLQNGYASKIQNDSVPLNTHKL